MLRDEIHLKGASLLREESILLARVAAGAEALPSQSRLMISASKSPPLGSMLQSPSMKNRAPAAAV